MRSVFRGRRSVVASVLVASLVTAMLGPCLHVDDGHDADVDAPIVVHDASQHRIAPDPATGETPAGDQHCLACHIVRLLRDDAVATVWFAPVALGGGRRVDRTALVVAQPDGPPLPARAPPALLFA